MGGMDIGRKRTLPVIPLPKLQASFLSSNRKTKAAAEKIEYSYSQSPLRDL
jgi:hypothetical protein